MTDVHVFTNLDSISAILFNFGDKILVDYRVPKIRKITVAVLPVILAPLGCN